MKTRVAATWENVRTSYWFLPAVMMLGGILLSFLLLWLDQVAGDEWTSQASVLWGGGVDGGREVLSVIAGSIITVAGVTFSITITAIALASNQFGPRILRSFMQDTGNQFVLGTFVATFLYNLLVLRAVGRDRDGTFVPDISITVGILLAVASIGVLVYFINHVTTLLQVENLAAAIAHDIMKGIDNIFPKKIGEAHPLIEKREGRRLPDEFDREAWSIRAEKSGYVEGIDNGAIMHAADKNDLLLRLQCRPGDFIVEGDNVMQVFPSSRCDSGLEKNLRRMVIIGKHRTVNQDVEYPVQQLVDVAVRALSPGVNNPSTAIVCIDWLGACIGKLLEREIPSPFRESDNGKLRVVATPSALPRIADLAFNQIRQYGCSSFEIAIRMANTIGGVASRVRRTEDQESLIGHLLMIRNDAMESIRDVSDREHVERSCDSALRALRDAASP